MLSSRILKQDIIKELGLIVSTVQYSNGVYETAVLNNITFNEIEMYSGGTFEEHKLKHSEWLKKYTSKVRNAYIPKEDLNYSDLSIKYKDFGNVYLNAVNSLKNDAVYLSNKDGGTCNLDKVIVELKYYREDCLESVAKHLGKGFRISKYDKSYYTLGIPNNSSQGSMRTYQVEYIAEYLRKNGYNATVMYVID